MNPWILVGLAALVLLRQPVASSSAPATPANTTSGNPAVGSSAASTAAAAKAGVDIVKAAVDGIADLYELFEKNPKA